MSISQNFPGIEPSLLLDFANVKKLDPRITFARASEGRYYDGQTVAKAEENLLLYSQEFDQSPWAGIEATVTANTTVAPDGTTTAETFTVASTTNFHGLGIGATLFPAGTYTVSFFVQENTAQYVALGMYNTTSVSAGAGFDLTAGTITGTGEAGSGWSATGAVITDVGGGWYRCSVVVTTPASATVRIYIRNTAYTSGILNESFAGADESVYIWGAQLEQRDSVTAYTPTTTQPITNYIPVLQTADANTARFDHDPVSGESLGLLVEEQRTNLLTYSEDFSDAAWSKSGATITSNAVIAPDGTLTVDKLGETEATALHRISQTGLSITSGVTYTFSVFVKAGERNFLNVNFNTALNARSTFDLTSGTVAATASGTASVTYIGNGWYRCSVTGTASSTAVTTGYIQINNSGLAGDVSYTGDGYSGIYIWGAQLEEGGFPTSYIPTTSAQVTRSADSASMTGTNFSEWYRADEGTVYVEASFPDVPDFSRLYTISDGTSNNRIQQAISEDINTQQFYIEANDVIQVNASSSIAFESGQYYKTAFGYKTNDVAYTVDGTTVGTDTSAVMPNVDRINFGGFLTGVEKGMTIKKFAFYPTRVSDTALQALTS